MPALTVTELLEAARRARTAGDAHACLAALAEAQAAAGGTEQLATVSWRRAKAEHDFGSAKGIQGALEPLLGLEQPFAGSEAALAATEPLVRRIRDELGYVSETPDRLLELAARAWRDRDDPIRALWVEVQLAWSFACRGDHDELFALLETAERLRPRDIRHAPSRHARAEDAEASLAWMQLDLSRTALRAGAWSKRPLQVAQALDSIEDAAEAAGLRRLADPWFLDAVVTACWAAGEEPDADYVAAWPRALETVSEPRRALHKALRRGWSGQSDAADAFQFAADHAEHHRLGPEWRAWALHGLLTCGEARAEPLLSELIEQAGLRAFNPSPET